MTDRLPVHALDPAGATDGQVPTYHAATGVAWTDGPVGGVQSVVAGTGVTVDDTDPAHPIVSATGGGGGSSTGTYRGDWTSGETLLATYDFAAQAVNDPPPAPFTYANGSGWVKVVNYVAFTTPIPSPPAHMMELRDNGAKLTLPVGTSHPTANKVRFWLGNNSDGGASAYVNGVQQGTELTGLGAGWEQRTVTVAPATDTVEWRHRRTNVAGSVAGYVARIEVLASSTASSYAVNDVVRYGSALWACLVANTAQTPGAGSDWQKIADITDPEVVRDTMATALVAGTGVTITPDDAADTITISATGGGGGTSLRSVDVPTDVSWGSASTYDLEADTDGTALPTGWTWVNQGTSTFEMKYGAAIITPQDGAAPTSDDAHRLIVHAASTASTWAFSAKITGPFPRITGWSRSAIVLRDSTTGKYIAYGFGTYASGHWIQMNYWNSPGVYGGTEPISYADPKGQDGYLRIKKVGATTYDFDYSTNGVVWYSFLTAHNLSGFLTPDQIGIMSRRPSGSIHKTAVHWLRVR